MKQPKFAGFGLLAELPFIQDPFFKPGDVQATPTPTAYNVPFNLSA